MCDDVSQRGHPAGQVLGGAAGTLPLQCGRRHPGGLRVGGGADRQQGDEVVHQPVRTSSAGVRFPSSSQVSDTAPAPAIQERTVIAGRGPGRGASGCRRICSAAPRRTPSTMASVRLVSAALPPRCRRAAARSTRRRARPGRRGRGGVEPRADQRPGAHPGGLGGGAPGQGARRSRPAAQLLRAQRTCRASSAPRGCGSKECSAQASGSRSAGFSRVARGLPAVTVV